MDHLIALHHLAELDNPADNHEDDLNLGFLYPRMRERTNPFHMNTDAQFLKRFRFTKEAVQGLTGLIINEIESADNRNNPLPPELQVCAALRFLATNSFQTVIGDLSNVHQSTVSRRTNAVIRAFAHLRPQYIHFPQRNELVKNYTQFNEMAHRHAPEHDFPGVIGAIDCTHVMIRSPGGDSAEVYRNCHNVMSINVQIICVAKMNILDIVARWPGSVHDSRIFANSRICGRFENGDFVGHLLGDAGYPAKAYLLTPFRMPRTPAERLFNRKHKSLRNVIERVNGVQKKLFPCLGSVVQLKLKNTLPTIIAASVLYNIHRLRNEPFPPGVDPDAIVTTPFDGHLARDAANGLLYRNAFVQQHFVH